MAIIDNGNGTFIIDYRDGQHKRHRQKIVGSKTMAKEILTKIKNDILDEKYFPKHLDKKLTFEEAANTYFRIHLSKRKSGPKLKYTVESIKKYFGKIPLSCITTEQVQEFYNQRMAETSPSTANRHFTTLRAIINKMIQLKKYRGENPCVGVKKQKDNPARTNFLKEEEIAILLPLVPKRSRFLVAFAIATGMRRGEILRLDWRDLDLHNGIIHIYESKLGYQREVPMIKSLYDTLTHLEHPINGTVFDISVKQLEADFKQAVTRAGLPKIRFHDLRHTFASHFMMRGGSLTDLQRILGHSDLKMTQRYAHFSPMYLRKSIEVMNNVIPQLM